MIKFILKLILTIIIILMSCYAINMAMTYDNWTKTIVVVDGEYFFPMTWEEYYDMYK